MTIRVETIFQGKTVYQEDLDYIPDDWENDDLKEVERQRDKAMEELGTQFAIVVNYGGKIAMFG